MQDNADLPLVLVTAATRSAPVAPKAYAHAIDRRARARGLPMSKTRAHHTIRGLGPFRSGASRVSAGPVAAGVGGHEEFS